MPTPLPQRGMRKRYLNRDIANYGRKATELLLAAKARVEARILFYARKGNIAASAAVRDSLYNEIRSEYQRLGGDIQKWATSMTTQVSKEWHRFAISDLPAGSADPSFARFSRQRLQDYIAFTNPANMGQVAAVNSLAAQDIRFLRQQFTEVFRLAGVTGQPMRGMQKDLRDRMLVRNPNWRFIDKGGRRWQPRNYFNMLSRTTVAEVSRASYADTAAEAGVDLMRIAGGPPTAVGTLKHPDPCWKWYDKVISMTGATPGYPTYDEAKAAGVWHPNCIHFLAAVLPDEEDEAKKIEEKTDGKRKETFEREVKLDEEAAERAA